jgi:putative transcriptional regulator
MRDWTHMITSVMDPTAGAFLVAAPELGDPNFMRSVVYLLEHHSGGSLGVIINRPLVTPLRELWGEVPSPLAGASAAAEGGPVERHHGLLLHGVTGLLGAQHMGSGLALGGDLNRIAIRWSAGPDQQGPRLFLGHSGWGPGQLADEVARGGWILRPGQLAPVLAANPDPHLWERLVAGGGLPEPSVN